VYSGDANNASATSPCGAPNESVVVSQRATTLTTAASAGVALGGSVRDTATIANGLAPIGTITFTLFGPNNPTCTGSPVFTSTVPIGGNGTYPSGSFTPVLAGTYNFVAIYSGDINNAPATSPCGAPNESVVVGMTAPNLTTTASAAVALGGSVSDTATLAGGVSPTGSITFNLFGPNNATCTGVPVFTSTVPVAGNGSYPSGTFTPVTAGTYRFTASYSGDANNGSANSPCNAPNESVVVSGNTPTLSTTASANINLGGTVTDSATLAGGSAPTGSITFTLFGPNNATCTGTPVFSSTVSVTGNGTFTSAPFTPTAAGTYRWVASYSGDANNSAVTSPCNAPNESVVVIQTTLTLTNAASPPVTVGESVNDTVTLAGGLNPTGTITFTLFGPDNSTCTGTPIFTSTVTVTGNGSYTSGSFTPTTPGIFRFVASYSGDANNSPVTTACGAAGSTVTVSPVTAAIPLLDPLGMALLTLALALAGVVAMRGMK